MYDKRELLCNLWVLRAPWVSGNFTVRLCWTKSTGLPLPNFFLGKEQPSKIDPCWTAKEIREMLSITLFQDFYFYIEYFRPWLHRAFWPHPFPSQCSAHTTVTIISLHLSHSKPHRHPSCETWGYAQEHNLPVAKTRVRQACHASSPQPFPDPPSNTHFALPAFILHHFHFSFKTLHCSTLNSLRRKVFYSTHYCFYQPNYIPVTSHQLIFHGHILIDINCITSPYLHISQALYHSFHYFAGLADL